MVTIQFDDDGEPHFTRLKPVELQQVLLNLSINARDAMPKGGEIRIGVTGEKASEGQPRFFRMTVADQGEGIAPDVRDRIFNPLVTTKGPGKGTGLGLAMVRRIVTQYGGEISFTTSTGHGTTFTIRWPEVDP
jgi:two-component system cell cycle sensor histidine kinase/response regulator CckA